MLERKEMLSERLSEPPTEIPQENQPVQVLLFCLSPKQSGRTECILNSQFFIKEHLFCSGYFLKLFCMPSCFLDAILIQETLLPKERKKFMDQNEVGSVRHLIALRNNYIRQMMISAWLRINPVLSIAQEDLRQATILKEKFEVCVKEYFKFLDLARLHQKRVSDMQHAKVGERLDHAAGELQKHLGFMIKPFLAGDRDIRSHIDQIRRSAQHNMERKQKAADAEIARNQKIDVLTAEKITEDSVQDALRAYEQACAAIPNDLRQDAREAVTALGDSPRPVGEYDSEIMQFYEKSMDRVHKAAVKTMPIPSDFDRQEQFDKNDNGFYRGRTM